MADVLSLDAPSPDIPHVSFTTPYFPHCSLSSPTSHLSPHSHCACNSLPPSTSPSSTRPVNIHLPSLPSSHPSSVGQLLHPISLEAAAALHRLTPTRSMRHHLSPDHIDLLHSALAYAPVECDSLTLQLYRTGLPHKCGLFQAGSNPHHISLFSTDHLRPNEPVGCGVGTLRPSSYLTDPSTPDDSLARIFFYSVEVDHLGAEYRRRGGVDLMVDEQACCNEMRFIRAVCQKCEQLNDGSAGGLCEMHKDGGVDVAVGNVIGALFGGGEASVEVRVVIHPRYLLPFIIVVALVPIEPFTELLVRWEEHFLHRYQQYALTLLCNTGWQLHRELALLLRTLREKEGKPHPSSTLPTVPLSAAAGGEYHQVVRPTESVFRRSGVVQVDGLRYDGMDEDVRASIQYRCEELIRRRQLETEEERAESVAAGRMRRSKVRGRARVAILSPSREEVNRLALTEVLSCRHPVRFYTPPDQPAFAAVFICSLEAGRPVALYPGTCRVDQGEPSGGAVELYSWGLQKNQLGLDEKLVIHADRIGGPARFINDCVFRRGGDDSVNIEAVAFINQRTRMPDLMLNTNKDVAAGEEAVVSYGPGPASPTIPLSPAGDAAMLRLTLPLCCSLCCGWLSLLADGVSAHRPESHHTSPHLHTAAHIGLTR